jgi:DNA invertase Pin-like site-specific DNA recombinase
MKICYKRVSTNDGSQSTERQFWNDNTFDKIFEDHASGKDMNREGLHQMIDFAREGDEVHMWDLSRCGRNLKNVIDLVQTLNDKGVTVCFEKEKLTFNGRNDNPMARLQLHILSAVYQFERSVLLQRQAEGIAVAKSKGKYTGRVCALSAEQRKMLIEKPEMPLLHYISEKFRWIRKVSELIRKGI